MVFSGLVLVLLALILNCCSFVKIPYSIVERIISDLFEAPKSICSDVLCLVTIKKIVESWSETSFEAYLNLKSNGFLAMRAFSSYLQQDFF